MVWCSPLEFPGFESGKCLVIKDSIGSETPRILLFVFNALRGSAMRMRVNVHLLEDLAMRLLSSAASTAPKFALAVISQKLEE